MSTELIHECYFGIPAAGGVAHMLNLRLAPEELAWIARSTQTFDYNCASSRSVRASQAWNRRPQEACGS